MRFRIRFFGILLVRFSVDVIVVFVIQVLVMFFNIIWFNFTLLNHATPTRIPIPHRFAWYQREFFSYIYLCHIFSTFNLQRICNCQLLIATISFVRMFVCVFFKPTFYCIAGRFAASNNSRKSLTTFERIVW